MFIGAFQAIRMLVFAHFISFWKILFKNAKGAGSVVSVTLKVPKKIFDNFLQRNELLQVLLAHFFMSFTQLSSPNSRQKAARILCLRYYTVLTYKISPIRCPRCNQHLATEASVPLRIVAVRHN